MELIQHFVNVWNKCESLLEFDDRIGNGRLELKFGVPKEDVDVFWVLPGLAVCMVVT